MAGIQKIKIPIKKSELNIQAIMPYLPDIYEKFCSNRDKIQKFWQLYENKHNIFDKERAYGDNANINNIVSTPHLWAMVNFKSGYALGNPKEYAQTEENQTDDIKYLNKYAKSVNLRSIDKNVAVWVYATGVGYYFIEPKEEIYDAESEAPFNVFLRASDTCAKIYSSYNGEEALFDILVTSIKKNIKGKEKDIVVVSIYLPNMYYEFEYNEVVPKVFKFEENKLKSKARYYNRLPLVEKYANENRIGIVEIGESLQNAIDNIYSNQVDNIEDIVNEMLIFKNCILGNTPEEKAQNLIDARKNGVLEITDPSENREADVKTLSTQLNHSDILTLMESLKNELYATCGVPIAVSDTSNGGNKQGALQLGNGWENSYDRLLDEINSFLIADYELLEKMLFICKKSKTSKLNELNASEIEIKYNPNMTDNILSKAQALQIFDNCNIPPELYIQWVRISNDAVTAAQIIKKYRESLVKVESESNNGNNNI